MYALVGAGSATAPAAPTAPESGWLAATCFGMGDMLRRNPTDVAEQIEAHPAPVGQRHRRFV